MRAEGFYWVVFPNADLDIAYWTSTGFWRASSFAQRQFDDASVLVLGGPLVPPAIPASPNASVLSAVDGLSPADIAALAKHPSPAVQALGQSIAARAPAPIRGVSVTP